jgi:AmmeMemoRadiSam system protein A
MEPSSLCDLPHTSSFTDQQRRELLQLAHRSIETGMRTGQPPTVDATAYDAALARPCGAFVTLHLHGQLHGCIGTVEPIRPLAVEVTRCAYAAAFEDPRFDLLTPDDLPGLQVHVSVLSTPSPMHVAGEGDLLRQLRPGIDGLVLEDAASGRRSTFLPAVWEKLPDPIDFVTQLKLKAGLPADHWSPSLQWSRYTAESIE